MHAANRPSRDKFCEQYGQYQERRTDAPTNVPNGLQLHARAQKAKEDTAAGSDGWRPVELKALPVRAWEQRAKLLEKCVEVCRHPTAYSTANMTALKKKENSVLPLEHRLLTIFSSLYRTETGAGYEILMPWIKTVLHPSVVGALSGWEASDIARDAQAFLEHATLRGEAEVLVSHDFQKFFDAFYYEWTGKFLHYIGMPSMLVDLTVALYREQKRRLKN